MTEQEKEQNILTFLQENDISYEYLCKVCPPKFIEIIKKEPHLQLRSLYGASTKYTDLNMLHPFDEEICSFSSDTFEGNEPNIENLKKYNLYNVVAFNANIDKLRETWKDMPDMDDDKDDVWPDHTYLFYSIEFGSDQPLIEAMFPKAFGEGCIMPKDVISRKDLIEKYSDRCTPHRKFGEVNGKRRVIEED